MPKKNILGWQILLPFRELGLQHMDFRGIQFSSYYPLKPIHKPVIRVILAETQVRLNRFSAHSCLLARSHLVPGIEEALNYISWMNICFKCAFKISNCRTICLIKCSSVHFFHLMNVITMCFGIPGLLVYLDAGIFCIFNVS